MSLSNDFPLVERSLRLLSWEALLDSSILAFTPAPAASLPLSLLSSLSPSLPALLPALLPLPRFTDPVGIPVAFCYFLVRQRSRINPRITKSSKDFHQLHVVRVLLADLSRMQPHVVEHLLIEPRGSRTGVQVQKAVRNESRFRSPGWEDIIGASMRARGRTNHLVCRQQIISVFSSSSFIMCEFRRLVLHPRCYRRRQGGLVQNHLQWLVARSA